MKALADGSENELQVTEASRALGRLATRVADACAAHTTAAAILLTGSTADGDADYFSDLDMVAYYLEMPVEQAVTAVRAAVGGTEPRSFGDRDSGAMIEIFRVSGIECQLVFVTIDRWEQDMATVLERLDVASPLQKAFSGLQHGIALRGEERIREWQARLWDYPDALATAMVEQNLSFMPIWNLQERLAVRDASLWFHQTLVENEQRLLGVLAGLNRIYFSSFQFKRLHRFVDRMPLAPEALADRMDAILHADPASAAAEMKRLVQETVRLVEMRMPQIDTSAVRRSLDAPPAAAWEVTA